MKINCGQCWKEFEQKWKRVLCITCTNLKQKENAKRYREAHIDELRERAMKNYYKKKILSNKQPQWD